MVRIYDELRPKDIGLHVSDGRHIVETIVDVDQKTGLVQGRKDYYLLGELGSEVEPVDCESLNPDDSQAVVDDVLGFIDKQLSYVERVDQSRGILRAQLGALATHQPE